jgi:acetylornithine/N-succinyldiaminopimelate aminotransferase
LIFDEVQTGVGRTGNWFFGGSEHAGGVEADIITLAKSLGSGVPVGACLVNECISETIKTNDLGTTFGGGMLAMAAVSATLEAIETDRMRENIQNRKLSARKIKRNRRSSPYAAKAVLIGIEFAENCKPIHQKLLENKIITGTSSNPNVLRFAAAVREKRRN